MSRETLRQVVVAQAKAKASRPDANEMGRFTLEWFPHRDLETPSQEDLAR